MACCQGVSRQDSMGAPICAARWTSVAELSRKWPKWAESDRTISSRSSTMCGGDFTNDG